MSKNEIESGIRHTVYNRVIESAEMKTAHIGGIKCVIGRVNMNENILKPKAVCGKFLHQHFACGIIISIKFMNIY